MPNQHLGGFWIKIYLEVTKTIKIDTCLPEVAVFAGKHRRKPPVMNVRKALTPDAAFFLFFLIASLLG